jgi:CheY-like chemotaxis protein
MSDRHVALIVEDEFEMAAELAELVRCFGHESLHAATLAEAQDAIDQGAFCYVLLDLQIKADAKSILPRIESGMSALRLIRQRYPTRVSRGVHLLPVLAVSGHGREPRTIIGAFQDGIDDFILKPLSSEQQDVPAKIRRCLDLAGRADHAACVELNACASAIPDVQGAFRHTADYSEIQFGGELYLFSGHLQRAVLRYLHQKVGERKPWCSGKEVLRAVGSSDVNMRMVNLFGRHPSWNTLVLSDGRGRYRLRTS